MTEMEWINNFTDKVKQLRRKDSWEMQFDDNIVPNGPNMGWQEYIRNTSAWFTCSMCWRRWPSNRSMVIFHMRLSGGQGTVKVRRLGQNCKQCQEVPMEKPELSAENLDVLLEKLMEKIRSKCYHEYLGERNRPFTAEDVKSPHEPDHCEACKLGICNRNF